MRVAVLTMVYNERIMLPIWLRHYRRQCPDATLVIVDHGSDDGSTNRLDGATVLRLARTPFDEEARVALIGDIQRGLLRTHDVAIHTDCDEMLVADPGRHTSLAAFLEQARAAVIAPVGLHLFQSPDEAAINLAQPILGQRRFVWFGAGMCKPMVARVPLRWHPGFHCCDHAVDYRTDLFHFHLATMDRTLSVARLRLTREMAWSKDTLARGDGGHQRIDDAEHLRRSYEVPARILVERGAAAFDFTEDLRRLVQSIRLADGFYLPTYFRGTIARIPDQFVGIV